MFLVISDERKFVSYFLLSGVVRRAINDGKTHVVVYMFHYVVFQT